MRCLLDIILVFLVQQIDFRTFPFFGRFYNENTNLWIVMDFLLMKTISTTFIKNNFVSDFILDSFVPEGYMKFDSDVGFQPPGEICSRDVTSPIDPSDHKGLWISLSLVHSWFPQIN